MRPRYEDVVDQSISTTSSVSQEDTNVYFMLSAAEVADVNRETCSRLECACGWPADVPTEGGLRGFGVTPGPVRLQASTDLQSLSGFMEHLETPVLPVRSRPGLL